MENKNFLRHISTSPYQHGSVSNPQILPANANYYFIEYPIYNPYDIATKSFYKKVSTENFTPMGNVKQKSPSTYNTNIQQNLANDHVDVFPRITKNNQKNMQQKLELFSKMQKLSNNEDHKTNNLTAEAVPYKNNPLFQYLKKQHTLDFSKVIQLRHKNPKNANITTLILEPQAMAVAGLQGTAIATPLSRAFVEKGTDVDIFFEPQSIAIAGPGGIAHAQSELEIGYIDS